MLILYFIMAYLIASYIIFITQNVLLYFMHT